MPALRLNIPLMEAVLVGAIIPLLSRKLPIVWGFEKVLLYPTGRCERSVAILYGHPRLLRHCRAPQRQKGGALAMTGRRNRVGPISMIDYRHGETYVLRWREGDWRQ